MNRSFNCSKAFLLCISTFCFTIYSVQRMLPRFAYVALLLVFPMVFCVCCFVENLLIRKLYPDAVALAAVAMILVMLFWHNYTIRNEGVIGMYGQIMPLLFFILCWRRPGWHAMLLRILMIWGMFYAIWTYICLFVPSLYYGTIAPMMERLYPLAGYIPDAKAGLTAHYSTNGMYLANGLMASIYGCFPAGKRKRKAGYVGMVAFQGLAFLICGKRGQLLCVAIALYVLYFVYQSNRPKGRLFKLMFFTFILVVLLYLATLILPAIANPILHMVEMMQKGDISTGRFALWGAGWKAFMQSPVFGHGWRWFYYCDTSVFVHYDIHNCYLQFLAETGILGSIPFFVFFFATYRRTLKMLRTMRWHPNPYGGKIPGSLWFSLMYQTFYLVFIFEGTAFFNPEAMFPYLASCAIAQYYFVALRKHRAGQERAAYPLGAIG